MVRARPRVRVFLLSARTTDRSPEDATPETLLTTTPVTDGALDPVVL